MKNKTKNSVLINNKKLKKKLLYLVIQKNYKIIYMNKKINNYYI